MGTLAALCFTANRKLRLERSASHGNKECFETEQLYFKMRHRPSLSRAIRAKVAWVGFSGV
jgi:hypothetical protein